MEDFLNTLDFALLAKQKESIINIRENITNELHDEHLDGIINLITTIQDFAVDEYDYEEKEVFPYMDEGN